MTATISKVSYRPEPGVIKSGEPDAMPRFYVAGHVDGQYFAAHISLEIDGRDGEVEKIAGVDVGPTAADPERWDAVLKALSKFQPFVDKHKELAQAYYGG